MTQLLGLLIRIPARLAISLGWGHIGSDVKQVLAAHATRPLKPLPSMLSEMMVLVEDRRFARHTGVDIRGIARALVNNIQGLPIQGGSTLEQQLVRSITDHRTLSLTRKIREALAASVVASRLTKAETAELLLHHCWFGSEMVGAVACATAKGVKLDSLTHQDAADMIARIRYPEYALCNAKYLNKIKDRSTYIIDIYLKSHVSNLP